MAIVKNIERQALVRDSKHSIVECTYDVVIGVDGFKYLQIDTYGSSQRRLKGKKSQSLRLAPEAIARIKEIFEIHAL